MQEWPGVVQSAMEASLSSAQRELAHRRAYVGEWAADTPAVAAVKRLWTSAAAAAARQAGALVRTILCHQCIRLAHRCSV